MPPEKYAITQTGHILAVANPEDIQLDDADAEEEALAIQEKQVPEAVFGASVGALERFQKVKD